MFGDGSTERDYTYVDDTLQGVLRAMRFLDQHPDTFEIVNRGESRTVPLTEMIDTVARTLGVTPEIERLPMRDPNLCGHHQGRSPVRLRPPPGFEEGVGRFVEWFNDHLS